MYYHTLSNLYKYCRLRFHEFSKARSSGDGHPHPPDNSFRLEVVTSRLRSYRIAPAYRGKSRDGSTFGPFSMSLSKEHRLHTHTNTAMACAQVEDAVLIASDILGSQS